MRRLRLLLGLIPALPIAASCAREPVRVALVMDAPQGLLASASQVTLAVFSASEATCVAGVPSAIPRDAQSFQLDSTGCAAGSTWCKTISLDKDGSTKVFAVTATSDGVELAQGCATAVINQDPLQVSIPVVRYNAPGCCNDGLVQVGEQCDSGHGAVTTCSGTKGGRCLGIVPDAVCECDCRAKEILLSLDDVDQPKLTNGPAGSKTGLAMTFAPGGPSFPNALRAYYENADPATARGPSDLNVRFLDQNLYPITTPYPLTLQLALPLACSSAQGVGLLGTQQSVAVAVASNSTVAVVYASDEVLSGTFDVFLSPETRDGCADDKQCTQGNNCQTGVCCGVGTPPPGEAGCGNTACAGGNCCSTSVQLNSPGTMPGISNPAIAGGPMNQVLAIWASQNTIFGRIWNTNGTLLPPNQEFQIVAQSPFARVAGSGAGWTVVYQGSGPGDGDGVFTVPVNPSGIVGQPKRVNGVVAGTQDQPDIATLTDGRTVVVWRSGGNIFFQRYDSMGVAVAHDQDLPLNTDTRTPLLNPAVGAGPDFFAVAWETATADIGARFVGGSAGFGYNSVTGQNDAFAATHPAIKGTRHHPSVTVGAYVVFGWEDVSAAHPGVYVRRFPLPLQ